MEARFSKDAENDIRSLITYGLSTYGDIVAQTYFSELSDCLESLAENPLMAPLCLRQNNKIRRFVFRAHVIYFAIYAPTILVLRVLHQRQDPIIEFIDSTL